MTSLVVSTIAFFVAGHYIKRYLDEHDIPKTFTRSVLVFVLAVAVSYVVAVVVDWLGA